MDGQPQIVASGYAGPSLWMNSGISRLKKLAASTFKSIIPELSTQYTGYIPNKNSGNITQDDTANSVSTGWSNFLNSENVALVSCIADALDNTSSRHYQDLISSKGVKVLPSVESAVRFGWEKFNLFVESKIENLDSKEQARIRVELEKAYPEIAESFKRGVEFSGNVGLDDVLEKCKKCFSRVFSDGNVRPGKNI